MGILYPDSPMLVWLLSAFLFLPRKMSRDSAGKTTLNLSDRVINIVDRIITITIHKQPL